MGLFKKYGKGLRFLLRKSNRKPYLEAVQLLFKDNHLDFSKGIGYTNWRNVAPEAVILMGNFKTGITFPDKLKRLGKIESIDFHNCKLQAMPKSITAFTDVKKLDFSCNSIGSLPLGIHKLEQLEELNLQLNSFAEFPERISTIKSLKKLDLRHNRERIGWAKLEVPEAVRQALPDCEILV